jgi:hypothetical protein
MVHPEVADEALGLFLMLVADLGEAVVRNRRASAE